MPQPPAYNRTKDFTEDFGSETDHSSLNTELDTASNSINDIRTNLAILQADDGKLNPNVVTTDSISLAVRNDLSAGILAAVGTSVAEAAASATAAALSETNLADAVVQTNASKVAAAASADSALASKSAADADAASALSSKNTAVAAEGNVTILAATVAAEKLATDANAASTLANKNASDANAAAAALSASSADASKVTVLAAAAEVEADRAAADTSAIAAAASAASINPANLVHRTGDESIAGIKTFANSPVVPADFCWLTKAVGEPFALRDDLAGVPLPPTNNDAYRYIKLTAADAYNTGVLTSESVSGSAPDVIATAVISLAGSPINGLTVNLLNTERRFIRAGSSGTLELDLFKSHDHGLTGQVPLMNVGGSNADTPVSNNRGTITATGPSGGIETRPKNQGATFYMRIK